MANSSTITSCYSVSCMDPRERIVEARYSKLMHVADAIENGTITGEIAEKIADLRKSKGIHSLDLAINFYRNARAGGGWSLDAIADLQTIKDNGLTVSAVYSTRHRQCAAIKVGQHLHDQDVAIMIVQDFNTVGLPIPPVFRAHLEVVSKHEEFDTQPMDLKALVAYAISNGTGPHFNTALYSAESAANILGLDLQDASDLTQRAGTINMTPKGLLQPTIELVDAE